MEASNIRKDTVPGTDVHDHRFKIYKIQFCRFALAGRCRRGSFCTFAHSLSDLRVRPLMKKTKICAAWRKKACPFDDRTCKFAHGTNDLQKGKPALCELFRAGKCNKGAQCRFAHSVDEISTDYAPHTPDALQQALPKNLPGSPASFEKLLLGETKNSSSRSGAGGGGLSTPSAVRLGVSSASASSRTKAGGGSGSSPNNHTMISLKKQGGFATGTTTATGGASCTCVSSLCSPSVIGPGEGGGRELLHHSAPCSANSKHTGKRIPLSVSSSPTSTRQSKKHSVTSAGAVSAMSPSSGPPYLFSRGGEEEREGPAGSLCAFSSPSSSSSGPFPLTVPTTVDGGGGGRVAEGEGEDGLLSEERRRACSSGGSPASCFSSFSSLSLSSSSPSSSSSRMTSGKIGPPCCLYHGTHVALSPSPHGLSSSLPLASSASCCSSLLLHPAQLAHQGGSFPSALCSTQPGHPSTAITTSTTTASLSAMETKDEGPDEIEGAGGSLLASSCLKEHSWDGGGGDSPGAFHDREEAGRGGGKPRQNGLGGGGHHVSSRAGLLARPRKGGRPSKNFTNHRPQGVTSRLEGAHTTKHSSTEGGGGGHSDSASTPGGPWGGRGGGAGGEAMPSPQHTILPASVGSSEAVSGLCSGGGVHTAYAYGAGGARVLLGGEGIGSVAAPEVCVHDIARTVCPCGARETPMPCNETKQSSRASQVVTEGTAVAGQSGGGAPIPEAEETGADDQEKKATASPLTSCSPSGVVCPAARIQPAILGPRYISDSVHGHSSGSQFPPDSCSPPGDKDYALSASWRTAHNGVCSQGSCTSSPSTSLLSSCPQSFPLVSPHTSPPPYASFQPDPSRCPRVHSREPAGPLSAIKETRHPDCHPLVPTAQASREPSSLVCSAAPHHSVSSPSLGPVSIDSNARHGRDDGGEGRRGRAPFSDVPQQQSMHGSISSFPSPGSYSPPLAHSTTPPCSSVPVRHPSLMSKKDVLSASPRCFSSSSSCSSSAPSPGDCEATATSGCLFSNPQPQVRSPRCPPHSPSSSSSSLLLPSQGESSVGSQRLGRTGASELPYLAIGRSVSRTGHGDDRKLAAERGDVGMSAVSASVREDIKCTYTPSSAPHYYALEEKAAVPDEDGLHRQRQAALPHGGCEEKRKESHSSGKKGGRTPQAPRTPQDRCSSSSAVPPILGADPSEGGCHISPTDAPSHSGPATLEAWCTLQPAPDVLSSSSSDPTTSQAPAPGSPLICFGPGFPIPEDIGPPSSAHGGGPKSFHSVSLSSSSPSPVLPPSESNPIKRGKAEACLASTRHHNREKRSQGGGAELSSSSEVQQKPPPVQMPLSSAPLLPFPFLPPHKQSPTHHPTRLVPLAASPSSPRDDHASAGKPQQHHPHQGDGALACSASPSAVLGMFPSSPPASFSSSAVSANTSSNCTPPCSSLASIRACTHGCQQDSFVHPELLSPALHSLPERGVADGESFSNQGSWVASPGEAPTTRAVILEAGRKKARSGGGCCPPASSSPSPHHNEKPTASRGGGRKVSGATRKKAEATAGALLSVLASSSRIGEGDTQDIGGVTAVTRSTGGSRKKEEKRRAGEDRRLHRTAGGRDKGDSWATGKEGAGSTGPRGECLTGTALQVSSIARPQSGRMINRERPCYTCYTSENKKGQDNAHLSKSPNDSSSSSNSLPPHPSLYSSSASSISFYFSGHDLNTNPGCPLLTPSFPLDNSSGGAGAGAGAPPPPSAFLPPPPSFQAATAAWYSPPCPCTVPSFSVPRTPTDCLHTVGTPTHGAGSMIYVNLACPLDQGGGGPPPPLIPEPHNVDSTLLQNDDTAAAAAPATTSSILSLPPLQNSKGSNLPPSLVASLSGHGGISASSLDMAPLPSSTTTSSLSQSSSSTSIGAYFCNPLLQPAANTPCIAPPPSPPPHVVPLLPPPQPTGTTTAFLGTPAIPTSHPHHHPYLLNPPTMLGAAFPHAHPSHHAFYYMPPGGTGEDRDFLSEQEGPPTSSSLSEAVYSVHPLYSFGCTYPVLPSASAPPTGPASVAVRAETEEAIPSSVGVWGDETDHVSSTHHTMTKETSPGKSSSPSPCRLHSELPTLLGASLLSKEEVEQETGGEGGAGGVEEGSGYMKEDTPGESQKEESSSRPDPESGAGGLPDNPVDSSGGSALADGTTTTMGGTSSGEATRRKAKKSSYRSISGSNEVCLPSSNAEPSPLKGKAEEEKADESSRGETEKDVVIGPRTPGGCDRKDEEEEEDSGKEEEEEESLTQEEKTDCLLSSGGGGGGRRERPSHHGCCSFYWREE